MADNPGAGSAPWTTAGLTAGRAYLHRPELPRWTGQEVAIGVGVRVAVHRADVANFMGNGGSMLDTTNATIGLPLP